MIVAAANAWTFGCVVVIGVVLVIFVLVMADLERKDRK